MMIAIAKKTRIIEANDNDGISIEVSIIPGQSWNVDITEDGRHYILTREDSSTVLRLTEKAFKEYFNEESEL